MIQTAFDTTWPGEIYFKLEKRDLVFNEKRFHEKRDLVFEISFLELYKFQTFRDSRSRFLVSRPRSRLTSLRAAFLCVVWISQIVEAS